MKKATSQIIKVQLFITEIRINDSRAIESIANNIVHFMLISNIR